MSKAEKENRINSLAVTFLEQQQIIPNLFADQIIRGYKEGYHQAEIDLELTWEDIETIQEMANKYCKYHSCEPRFFVYKEVLKRFKDLKK